MAAAKVECVFYGASISVLEKKFFSKIGVILTFPLH